MTSHALHWASDITSRLTHSVSVNRNSCIVCGGSLLQFSAKFDSHTSGTLFVDHLWGTHLPPSPAPRERMPRTQSQLAPAHHSVPDRSYKKWMDEWASVHFFLSPSLLADVLSWAFDVLCKVLLCWAAAHCVNSLDTDGRLTGGIDHLPLPSLRPFIPPSLHPSVLDGVSMCSWIFLVSYSRFRYRRLKEDFVWPYSMISIERDSELYSIVIVLGFVKSLPHTPHRWKFVQN